MSSPARWLWSVNPLGAPGSGPWAIFQKDVRAAGRRRLTYWSRGLYALAFAFLVGIVLLAVVAEQGWQGPAAQLQRMQRVAPILATAVLWFQFIGLVFAGPLFTGPSLSDERRNRTLSALLTTPLSAGQIVMGKFLGAMSQLVVLAIVPVPVLLAIRVFGGLDVYAVLAGTAVALGAAALAGSWAMVFSLNATRGVNAAMGAWAMMVFFHGLLPLVAISPIGLPRLGIPVPAWFGPAFCPPMALMSISERLVGNGRMAMAYNPAVCSLAGSLLVAILLWLTTTVLLRSALTRTGGEFQTRRELRKEARARRRASLPASAPVPGAPPSTADRSPSAAPRRTAHAPVHSRTVGDHPVLWREVRQSAFGSRTRLLVVAGAAALVLATIYVLAGIRDPEVHQIIAILSVITFTATACAATTSTIGGERDARTWGVLLTTPLTPRRIIWAKFAGGLARLWPVPLVMVICLCVIAPAGGVFRPLPLALYFGSFVAIAAFLCASGVCWSLVVRRVALASVFNVLLAAGIWLVAPFLVAIFIEIASSFGSPEDQVGVLFSGNPVALAISAMAEFDSRPPRAPLGIRGNVMPVREYTVASLRYAEAEFVLLCIGVWVVYGIVALAILESAAHRLARSRDRLA